MIARVVALVLLFAAAYPLERTLREQAPPAPAANRVGMGRLLGGVLTGPFRPILQTYLWLRGDILYGQGRIDETVILYRTMVALYPHNEAAKEYLGWHICFNHKNEAPNREVAWLWSREGLDILAELPGAQRQLADWMLKQCGQDATRSMRYAGRDWENEKWLRARVRDWSEKHRGEPLERFDIGLRVLEGREKFFDRLRKRSLLYHGAIDDCLRLGRSDKFDPAIELTLAMSKELDAPPELWREPLEERAWILGELKAKRVSDRLIRTASHDVAMALWGLGAHGRDRELLRAAAATLRAYELANEVECPEEMESIRASVVRLGSPDDARPLPLPFD